VRDRDRDRARRLMIKLLVSLVLALIATFVGLVVTDVVSDGLSISGAWTWVLATIIVWLGALLAGLLLPVIFVKRRVQDDRRLTIRSA
jgi:hypothetical protein